MATAPGTRSMTAPKADQPRATTESLKKGEASPNLTMRQTGIKTMSGRSQRDYARK
jgi:hypothetical protein